MLGLTIRQWVLTVPYRLRYQMAWNHGLSSAVQNAKQALAISHRGFVLELGRPASKEQGTR